MRGEEAGSPGDWRSRDKCLAPEERRSAVQQGEREGEVDRVEERHSLAGGRWRKRQQEAGGNANVGSFSLPADFLQSQINAGHKY